MNKKVNSEETYAEWRTRTVREERCAKQEAYRKLHNIGKTEMYYHEDENMYRADYLDVTLVKTQ